MISRGVSCRARLVSSCLQNHPRPWSFWLDFFLVFFSVSLFAVFFRKCDFPLQHAPIAFCNEEFGGFRSKCEKNRRIKRKNSLQSAFTGKHRPIGIITLQRIGACFGHPCTISDRRLAYWSAGIALWRKREFFLVISACWQVNPQMRNNDFPMDVLSNAISVFLSTKSSAALVVLVRFFPRSFLGLAFCVFLPKVRFFITTRPDRVLQRRVRRFSFEMRKIMLVKKNPSCVVGSQLRFLCIPPLLVGASRLARWSVGIAL